MGKEATSAANPRAGAIAAKPARCDHAPTAQRPVHARLAPAVSPARRRRRPEPSSPPAPIPAMAGSPTPVSAIPAGNGYGPSALG